MDDDEIRKLYSELRRSWQTHLEPRGVILPDLEKGEGFTKNALVLVFLFKNLGKPVSKTTLTNFIRERYPDTPDVQQGRHLSGKGWFIVSGTREEERKEYGLPHGFYTLVSVEDPHPKFSGPRKGETEKGVSLEEAYYEDSGTNLDELTEFVKREGHAVLYGPPGTGKTHLALVLTKRIAGEDYLVARLNSTTTPGEFLDLVGERCERALEDPERPVALVVDDVDWSTSATLFLDLAVALQHRNVPVVTDLSKRRVTCVPSNLVLLATTTQTPSSGATPPTLVGSLPFVPVPPDERILSNWFNDRGDATEETKKLALNLFQTINRELKKCCSLQFGHAYFFAKDERGLWQKLHYTILPSLEARSASDAELRAALPLLRTLVDQVFGAGGSPAPPA
ncbi:MAG: hypothetical protein Kow0069_35880 [Promethearchaeota archaeon]